MNKFCELLMPLVSNHTANSKLRSAIRGKDRKGNPVKLDCILNTASKPNRISEQTLKKLYADEQERKSKLEDKAKTNVVGVTIAITLIMGASSFLGTAGNQLASPIFKWATFGLYIISVLYMLLAGILAIEVLIKENRVYLVSPENMESNKASRKDYDQCIGENRAQNLIRNNKIFTSYECIRNALICLFIIFTLSIIPISCTPAEDTIRDYTEQYEFFFSSDTLNIIEESEIMHAVENTIAKDIACSDSVDEAHDVSILDQANGLFIKYSVNQKRVNVLLVEKYKTPS